MTGYECLGILPESWILLIWTEMTQRKKNPGTGETRPRNSSLEHKRVTPHCGTAAGEAGGKISFTSCRATAAAMNAKLRGGSASV